MQVAVPEKAETDTLDNRMCERKVQKISIAAQKKSLGNCKDGRKCSQLRMVFCMSKETALR